MSAQKLELRPILVRFQPLIALLLMVGAMWLSSDRFLSLDNGVNILQQISVNVCLSIGMTLVILSGGIDLSVGAILALAGVVTAGLWKNGIQVPGLDVLVEFTLFGAVASGLLVGLLLGLFNGLMVTRFRIPPFVATLGMFMVARGLAMLYTGGFPITRLGEAFAVIGSGKSLRIPIPLSDASMRVYLATPILIYAALVGVFVLVTKKTRFGRGVYAVGGNERAAWLCGLRVGRIKLGVYALCGLLSAVGGLIVTSRLDSARPNAGLGYELDAIAAVVIGGTSLSGGRGSILGTLLGCLIIGVLNNGLILLKVSPFWQQVVKGLVILLAVAIDKMGSRND